MNEYGYAIDGMLYHVSQAPQDEHGRRVPRPGAQCGYILKASEFGEMPELTPEAQALVDMWRAEQGVTVGTEELTPATPTHVATYGTKVMTAEPPPTDILTKADDAPVEDATADEQAAAPEPTTNVPRSRPGGR